LETIMHVIQRRGDLSSLADTLTERLQPELPSRDAQRILPQGTVLFIQAEEGQSPLYYTSYGHLHATQFGMGKVESDFAAPEEWHDTFEQRTEGLIAQNTQLVWMDDAGKPFL